MASDAVGLKKPPTVGQLPRGEVVGRRGTKYEGETAERCNQPSSCCRDEPGINHAAPGTPWTGATVSLLHSVVKLGAATALPRVGCFQVWIVLVNSSYIDRGGILLHHGIV